MMGSQGDRQDPFSCHFRLDDHVPADHLLRRIDAVSDLSGLHEHLAPYYRPTGRSSIDPEPLIRMLIVGYCHGIRSERQLCDEVGLNLAYRWFCRLSIKDTVPEHSTLSETRYGRFCENEILPHIPAIDHSGRKPGQFYGYAQSRRGRNRNKNRSDDRWTHRPQNRAGKVNRLQTELINNIGRR